MRSAIVDEWSYRDSFIHARDARVKILATLAFLIVVSTTPAPFLAPAACYAGLLVAGVLLARLPLGGLLLRTSVVLPFSATFAVVSLLAGDSERAGLLLGKSLLSAMAVVLLVATTPLPSLLSGAERLGAPRMVVLVIQFLYRYLFVIVEQGRRMRHASECRGGHGQSRATLAMRFHGAAGALGVLFGRSYQRAEAVHRAMLARGFTGDFRSLSAPALRAADVLFLILAVALPAALRWAVWR